MTRAKTGGCAACWETDGGGFRGIPAWLGCGGVGVILRSCCLQYLLAKHNRRMKKRIKLFSIVDGAQCQIHLPGGPALLLEESLGDHQHTGAPHQWCMGGSGWDHLGLLVLIKDWWRVKEVKKHHYGPQHGKFH